MPPARRRTTLLGAADDELSGGDRQARRNQIAQTRSLADGQERIGVKIHTSLLWAGLFDKPHPRKALYHFRPSTTCLETQLVDEAHTVAGERFQACRNDRLGGSMRGLVAGYGGDEDVPLEGMKYDVRGCLYGGGPRNVA